MCREARARCFREGSNIDGRSEPPFRLCSRKVFAMSPKKKAKKKSSAKKKTSKKAATTKKSKTAAKKGPAKKAKSSVQCVRFHSSAASDWLAFFLCYTN